MCRSTLRRRSWCGFQELDIAGFKAEDFDALRNCAAGGDGDLPRCFVHGLAMNDEGASLAALVQSLCRQRQAVFGAVGDDGQSRTHAQAYALQLCRKQRVDGNGDLVGGAAAVHLGGRALHADGLDTALQGGAVEAVAGDLYRHALAQLVQIGFFDAGDRLDISEGARLALEHERQNIAEARKNQELIDLRGHDGKIRLGLMALGQSTVDDWSSRGLELEEQSIIAAAEAFQSAFRENLERNGSSTAGSS